KDTMLTLTIEIASDLAGANSVGFVHVDIKPANILSPSASTQKFSTLDWRKLRSHLVLRVTWPCKIHRASRTSTSLVRRRRLARWLTCRLSRYVRRDQMGAPTCFRLVPYCTKWPQDHCHSGVKARG